MRVERFRVLVLLAGGLITVQEAEEALYPSRFANLARRARTALFWSGICAAALLLAAGAVAERNDWNPWIDPHLGFLPWNGPTVTRHVHAVLWALFGGL